MMMMMVIIMKIDTPVLNIQMMIKIMMMMITIMMIMMIDTPVLNNYMILCNQI